MKRFATELICNSLLLGWSGGWGAPVELLSPAETPRVFAGASRMIAVSFRNRSDVAVETSLSILVWQASSETVMNLGGAPWKNLKLLPGQTVTELAQIGFPDVKAETRFLIQWMAGGGNVVGNMEVFVYPTNLLAQLKTIAGSEPIGLFDPGNQLKPLLQLHEIEFDDLAEAGTDKFHNKLAIFGPFEARSQMRGSLKDDIRTLAKRGVAVVWLQPPPDKHAPLNPSFFVVREGAGVVVVAAHDLVGQLVERPEAQLNLLRVTEAALHPKPLDLPETERSN